MTTNARPAPAWDEEAARADMIDAVAQTVWNTLRIPGYTALDVACAVVREHLPVKPGREDIYRAWHGTDDPWGGCADSASIERVLDLWPGRSEAEVKVEALRDAADAVTEIDGRADDDAARWLRARADRLADGGDDRG